MSLRPPVQRRLDALDAQTQRLFLYLESVRPEQLTLNPQPGYWNALETINHIYLGEKASIQYIHHKLSKPETISERRPDAYLRTLLVKWALFSPLKFKSPPHINMRNDQPVLELEELRQVWTALRLQLRALLDKQEEAHRHKLVYKHPYGGRMTLNQMLIFFEDHLAHHTRQIRSILAQVRLLNTRG